MGLLARIGGKRVAAPPFGAHTPDAKPLDLLAVGERYRSLLELGEETGVIPQLEFWGFSKNLSRLSQASLVAVESGHPDANILGDVYHIYKGGSDPQGLRLLSAEAFRLFHVNDYPAIPRDEITDADRVFPGDGVAPLTSVFRALRAIGFEGVLSLELFNVEYYKMDPLMVARTGLEKLRECVQKSFD
jgi:sugar phosphate isomerase/epimerase